MLSTYEPYTKLSPKKKAKYFAMKITYGTKFKVGTSNYKKLRRTWMDFNKFHINLIHKLEMKPFPPIQANTFHQTFGTFMSIISTSPLSTPMTNILLFLSKTITKLQPFVEFMPQLIILREWPFRLSFLTSNPTSTSHGVLLETIIVSLVLINIEMHTPLPELSWKIYTSGLTLITWFTFPPRETPSLGQMAGKVINQLEKGWTWVFAVNIYLILL